MKLTRNEFNEYGVMGLLATDDASTVFCTLEHSYIQPDGNYISKIPNGSYLCVRGTHQLEGMKEPFETFQILVEGHTNILFHVGNTNSDSSGCVLLGLSCNDTEVLHSRDAFDLFMELMVGIDSFTLTVSSGGTL